MTQRKLFVIRHVSLDAYCTSSKYRHFYNDFSVATIFLQEANAIKAIKEMKRPHHPYYLVGSDRDSFGTRYTFEQNTTDVNTPYLPLDLEVVTCTLSTDQ